MHPAFRAGAVVLATVLSALPASPADAQAPTVSTIAPLGLRPGQTQEIVIRGGNLEGAAQLWTSFPAESVLAAKPNNGKSAGDVTYQVAVPPGTPPGIYAARVATARGISALHTLVVDDLPAVLQQPSNVNPAGAQSISLPAAVDGAIASLSRNYYKVHVEAGQRLAIEVFARRIGSPLDPTLRLLDANGREIAYSDDIPGLSEDAQMSRTFASAGDYLVEVGDNLYQGGPNYVYRLRIGDFPAAVVAMPPAATRGTDATIQFAAAAEAAIEPARVKAPADPLLRAMSVPAKFAGGSVGSFATVLLSDRKQANEVEPNNDLKSATRVDAQSDVNGRLQAPADVDRFVFPAKAGHTLRFAAAARELGSPADVVLRLLKIDGSQLAQAEGSATGEATLSAAIPADGDYVLEVSDLNHRGGPRFVYHVDVSVAQPAFALIAESESINVPAGGTAIVTVAATRSGYGGPIAVRAADLPAGITSIQTVIGEGRSSVVLSLQAAKDAPAGKVHPLRIVGMAHIGNAEFQSSATVTTALQTLFGGMPHPPLALAHCSAVGIAPPPEFVLRTEPATAIFGHGLSASVKVIVERRPGFDEEIALAVTPEKEGLPSGITAALKPIPKGASSVEIAFASDNKPPLGEYTAVVNATLKKGNQSHVHPAPGIGLKLERPFGITVGAASGKLPRKGRLALTVTAARNPAFKGEIVLAVSNLPKGVTASAARLPAGSNKAEIVLSAQDDAQPGPAKDLKVVAESMIGKDKFTASSPVAVLAVE